MPWVTVITESSAAAPLSLAVRPLPLMSVESPPKLLKSKDGNTPIAWQEYARESRAKTGSSVVPLSQGNDGALIVDIVEVRVRVLRIVDNHRTTQTVTVLRGQVAVVPECAGLVGGGEVVEERVARGDGALVDKGGAISPVCALLEETVPVLSKECISTIHK